jgi:hypothetical protein
MKTLRRMLTLRKGTHTYVFQYVEGCERDLLAALVDLAERSDQALDWFDAAVLSYQMQGAHKPETTETPR